MLRYILSAIVSRMAAQQINATGGGCGAGFGVEAYQNLVFRGIFEEARHQKILATNFYANFFPNPGKACLNGSAKHPLSQFFLEKFFSHFLK